MKTRKQSTRKSLILRICIFCFVVYAAFSLVRSQITIAALKQEYDVQLERHESLRLVNRELERQMEYGYDEEAIERIARDKLGYVRPDEIIFIDISGS